MRKKHPVIKKNKKIFKSKILPKAEFSGELLVGNSALPCYVLGNEKRVFSTMGMLRSLEFNPKANADEVFNAKDIKPYLPKKDTKGTIMFVTDRGTVAKGYDVEYFMDICHAFSKAYEEDSLHNKRNIEAAKKANMVIRACSKIGIIALVDEATGYQYARAEDALQFKLKLYLSEEMRGWEKTFPDDLWKEFARLTRWGGEPTKNRPRHWGYLVMDLIYRYLDKDVAEYLKKNKPKPQKGKNYHQWFNEDYGVRKLVEHINRVIGMAQGCESLEELKRKMAYRYGDKPLQLELFFNSYQRKDALKISNSFEDAVKKIVRPQLLNR